MCRVYWHKVFLTNRTIHNITIWPTWNRKTRCSTMHLLLDLARQLERLVDSWIEGDSALFQLLREVLWWQFSWIVCKTSFRMERREETCGLWVNPCWQKQTMQTPHMKDLGPPCCEATMLPTLLPCVNKVFVSNERHCKCKNYLTNATG